MPSLKKLFFLPIFLLFFFSTYFIVPVLSLAEESDTGTVPTSSRKAAAEARQAEIKRLAEQRKASVSAKRQEIKENVAEKRAEVKKNIEAMKDARKKALAERIQEKMANINK